MRVALVVPKSKIRFNDACAPLNLGYIASYLRKHMPNVEIKIVDGMAGDNPTRELFKFQPDIVGITATTPQAPEAYRLADSIRRNRPDILVVIGGVHASALPHEALEHAHIIVVGEGEEVFRKIVAGELPNSTKAHFIYQGKPLENIDDIPSPAFDLLKMREYLKHGPPFPRLKHPIMSMVTSRGCPFKCPFCHNSFRRYKPSYFSAKRIADEIEYFISEYGIKSVFFNDDEFFVNVKRLKKLAVEFKQRGINKRIKWGCQARVNSINPFVLELAKRMGCVCISPGFESASQRVLDYLKCGTTKVEDAEKAIRLCNEYGIVVGGSFIFGTPTETLEEMKQTFRWFEHNPLKFIGINTIIPYPGTLIWKYAKHNGLLPENVDYELLVPTSVPSETYIINRSVPKRKFIRFVTEIQRIAWVITQARLHPTVTDFSKMARYKTWWWMWLFHPHRMLKLVLGIIFSKSF